jgi:integrase
MPDEAKAKKRSRRGSGSVFQKANSSHWVVQYYKYDPDKGKSVRVREYTKLQSRTAAQKVLNDRLSKIDRGEQFGTRRPATVDELYEALKTYTENNSHSKRSVAGIGWRWKHLKPFFAGMRAANVTTDAVEKYKRQRRGEGAAPATINRELATLGRAFNYGKRCTPPKVFSVPYIQMFRENNARQGFIEETAFGRMSEEARLDGLWLRAFLEVAYSYGWRRGELLDLRVRHVDLSSRTIRLNPGSTKNGEGREVTMTPEVEELLRAAVEGKGPNDFVFTREDGKPVKDFRGVWRNLCVRAGTGRWVCRKCGAALTDAKCAAPTREGDCCGGVRKYSGLIPHDFRRSAAKAARRAGVPESVIMAMGGWKTPSMFRRYAIVSSADQRAAVEMIVRERAELRAREERLLSPPFSPPRSKSSNLDDERGEETIQ